MNLPINNSSYSVIYDTVCEPYESPSGNYIYTSTGTYYDTIIKSNGCPGVYELNLDITIIDTSISIIGNTLSSNHVNALHYIWLDCNDNYSQIGGTTSQTFTPVQNGNYAVRITDATCIDTSECVDITWLGIEDTEGRRILFSPNPSQGIIHLNYNESFELQLMSLGGQVVFSKLVEEGAQSPIVIPGGIKNGIYILRIANDNMILSEKLVLDRL